ncbi:hypothetical protein [Deinococcus sp. S9]|uniref:hypothetical protein n=1 Tax=Deinococcus sp. S9 TaxID=2545754 RepID=UPI001404D70C|nr:hypothetical protein [Deinococcus sp. S9]
MTAAPAPVTGPSCPCTWPIRRFRLEVERLTVTGRITEAHALIAAFKAGTPWKEGQRER